MGKHALMDAVITVDGHDVTDRANQVSVSDSADEKDSSTFRSRYKQQMQGPKDATITVRFFQDYDLASIDAILNPLYENGSTFSVKVKPFDETVSTTNPQRRMPEAQLFEYSPIDGEFGELSMIEAKFRNAGQQGVVRDTSETS
jgi:hypothetical protein